MKLEGTVAKALVKALPGTIVRRLLDNEEFSSFSKVSLISYQGMGSFYHADMLTALERARVSGERVDLVARNNRHFFLERLQEGIRIAPTESVGDGRLVPELGFLDPEQEVRLGAFNHAKEQCWPSLPSASQWQSILAERPLSEIELARLISDIRESPSQLLAIMERKWRSGSEMEVSAFFPTSLAYYEALVGPPPEGIGVGAWIDVVLVPYLDQRLRQSLIDGLRCALPLNVDPMLSPARLVSDVPALDLIAVLRDLVNTRSPMVLLGILEIALSRLDADGRFGEIASDVLDRLVGEKSKEIGIVQAWQMMPVIVKAGLRRMSVEEEMWVLPPYWRRLAAFAHANALLEMLEADSTDVNRFVDWLDDLETPAEVSAALLDMRREPMWIARDLTPVSFRATIVGRLIACKAAMETRGLELPNGHLVDSAVVALKADGGLRDTVRPGPLLDGIRKDCMEGSERTDSESLAGIFSNALVELGHEPAGDAWNGLAKTCRLLRFDDALLDALAKLPERMTLGDEAKDMERFFEALASAANIAATQPCEALANAIAVALIREAGRFSKAREAEAGYRILMMSSGGITDDANWNEWIGSRMSDYAFSLPKGEACSQLLASLDELQSQMPIIDRCIGRARKFASSAIY